MTNKEVIERLKKEIATIESKLELMSEMEDELGIDLITFVKVVEAISKGKYIWTKYDCHFYFPDIEDTNDVVLGDEYNGLKFIYFYWDNGKHLVLEIKDYGKTWALTKEELCENTTKQ